MALVDRFRRRLADQHQIVLPPGTELRRTHAGWAMKAAGAWSWFLWSPDLPRGLGAQIPATALLRCRHWTIDTSTFDRTIDLCPRCQGAEPGACR